MYNNNIQEIFTFIFMFNNLKNNGKKKNSKLKREIDG